MVKGMGVYRHEGQVLGQMWKTENDDGRDRGSDGAPRLAEGTTVRNESFRMHDEVVAKEAAGTPHAKRRTMPYGYRVEGL